MFTLLLLVGAVGIVLWFQRDGMADSIRGASLLGGAAGIAGGWRFLRGERERFRRDGPPAILDEGWLPVVVAAAFSLGATLAIVFGGGIAYYGLEAVGRLLRTL